MTRGVEQPTPAGLGPRFQDDEFKQTTSEHQHLNMLNFIIHGRIVEIGGILVNGINKSNSKNS